MHLNLLSPKKKKEIEWRHLYEFIKEAGFILSIFLLLISFFLVFAKLTLSDMVDRNADEGFSLERDSEQNKTVEKVNKRLREISGIQNGFVPWSGFIETIAQNSNQKIKFRSIEADKEEKKINIKGNASDRASLLEFKHNLENSEMFAKIIFPIDNILKKEDIDFNIDIKIDPEKNNAD